MAVFLQVTFVKMKMATFVLKMVAQILTTALFFPPAYLAPCHSARRQCNNITKTLGSTLLDKEHHKQTAYQLTGQVISSKYSTCACGKAMLLSYSSCNWGVTFFSKILFPKIFSGLLRKKFWRVYWPSKFIHSNFTGSGR